MIPYKYFYAFVLGYIFLIFRGNVTVNGDENGDSDE